MFDDESQRIRDWESVTLITEKQLEKVLGISPESAAEKFAELSDREAELLGLLICGLIPRQIAKRLGICRETVYVHRRRIRRKLGVKTMVDLVRLVLAKRFHDEVSMDEKKVTRIAIGSRLMKRR